MDGRGDLPMSSRHSNLKKSFKLGIRSLLTAFSKEVIFDVFFYNFSLIIHEASVYASSQKTCVQNISFVKYRR